MVDEITPTYYAAGEIERVYTLRGVNFEYLPDGAIGLYANDNSNPLQYADRAYQASNQFSIVSRSSTELVLRQGVLAHGTPNYLGAILSRDGETIYWVNNTQPLPPSRGDIVDPEFIDER